MSKQTLVLIIILSLFTAALIALAVSKSSYTTQVPPPNSSAAPTINPHLPDTSLMFGELEIVFASQSATVAPQVINATQSGTKREPTNEYLIPITINTGENLVTTVQLELGFDPKILTNININPADFFENPAILIHQIDLKNGRISYALAASQSNRVKRDNHVRRGATGTFEVPSDATLGGKKGEGIVATITFQSLALDVKTAPPDETKSVSSATVSGAQAPKQTSIIFLPKTFVVAQGLGESALKSTNSAKLTY